MTFKWATFVFYNIITPVASTHIRYLQRKAVIDRFLESRTFKFNVGVGCIFGTVLYYAIAGLSPFIVRGDPNDKQAKRPPSRVFIDADQIDALAKTFAGGEFIPELPAFALERVKYAILTRMCTARDDMDLKRQRQEVVRVAAELAALKGQKTSEGAASTS